MLQNLYMFTGFIAKISDDNSTDMDKLQEIMTNNRYTVDTAAKALMYPCRKLLYRCRWQNEIVDCSKVFNVAETYHGYCCAFNLVTNEQSVKAHLWGNIRYKSPFYRSTKKDKDIHPKKTKFFGTHHGLSVILHPLSEPKSLSTIDSDGVKMIVNEYNEYPSENSIEKVLPSFQESFVEIQPERTFCSEPVRHLSISDRGCYFENEWNLKFYNRYSEANCQVECRMKQVIDLCGCLPYYYLQFEQIEVCNFTKIKCFMDNYSE